MQRIEKNADRLTITDSGDKRTSKFHIHPNGTLYVCVIDRNGLVRHYSADMSLDKKSVDALIKYLTMN